MNKNTPVALALLLLALSGCVSMMADDLNKLSPNELAQLSDSDMCYALRKFGFSDLFNSPVQPSPAFVNDFNRRNIACEQHEFYIQVVYNEHRFDAGDDGSCRGYGLTPAAADYANCRLQIRAQRAGAAQTQQLTQAQQQQQQQSQNWANAVANMGHAYSDSWQQYHYAGPYAVQPSTTSQNYSCVPINGGVSCTHSP